MTLVWNGDAALDHVREQAALALIRAAVMLQTEHMRRVGVSNPPPHTTPAAKGEWPRKRTGFGQGSVVFDPADLAAVKRSLRIRVGYLKSAFYMSALTSRGWRGIYDTAEAIRGQLAQALGPTGEIVRG